MTQPVIEFWFDFGSSYAYFASLEIEALAAKHGREVAWRPFMLGQAFNITGARGLSSTPLKRDYALRDWERIARLRGVKYALPAHHPSVAVPAMRAFYHLERRDAELAAAFAKAVFAAYFHHGADIGDAGQVRGIGEAMGLDGEDLARAMADPDIKALAKARSQEAVDRGVFGSPWMFVDGEPFWGWDRLPMIDDWLTWGGW
jgi:2-hydroxychromene-2-carboxylate isomerase